MQISEAKWMLSNLSQSWDQKCSLDTLISKLFVPAAFWDTLVSKDSWHGQISSLLSSNVNKREQRKRINQCLEQALKAIENDAAACQEIPLEIRVALHRQLIKDEPTAKDLINTSPELDQIAETIQKEKETTRQKNLQYSRLRKEKTVPYTFDQFNQCFEDDTTSIEVFLKRHPEYQHPQIEERKKLLAEGNNGAQRTAQQWVDHIKQLSSGKKTFFKSAFGHRSSSLTLLLSAIRMLPDVVWKDIDPRIAIILKGNNNFDLNKELDQLLADSLGKIKTTAMDLNEVIDLNRVDSLFESQNRKVWAGLARWLPSFIESHLESWVKTGIMGSILEFFPDSPLRDKLKWISQNSDLLKDLTSRKKYIDDLEKEIMAFIKKPFKDLVDQFQRQGEDQLINTIGIDLQGLFPRELQDLLGLTSKLSSGAFWLQIERQPDNLITVLVFVSGNLLHHHPKDPQTKKTHWPLRLTNIDPAKFNLPFFERLLQIIHDSQQNDKYEGSPRDLYSGVLAFLEGEPHTQLESDWKHFGKIGLTDQEEVQTFLCKSEVSLDKVKFDMHWEALLGFCQTLLTGKEHTLTVKDPRICKALKHAVKRVLEEAEASKEQIGEKRLQEVKATCFEIREAIAPKEETSTVSCQAESPTENRLGLLTNHRDLLVWMFGEAAGDCIDYLNESHPSDQSLKNLPSNVAKDLNKIFSSITPRNAPSPTSHPQGWIRTILFSPYFGLSIKVMKALLAIKALPFRSLPFFFYSHLQTTLAICWPYLPESARKHLVEASNQLWQAMPDPVKQAYGLYLQTHRQLLAWYEHLMAVIMRVVIEFACKKVLPLILPANEMQAVNAYVAMMHQYVDHWAGVVQGTNTVRYDILPHKKSEPIAIEIPPIANHAIEIQGVDITNDTFNESLLLIKPLWLNKTDLNSSTLVSYLSAILNNSEQITHKTTRRMYLCRHIELLTVPQHGKTDYWDQIEDVQQCLENLHFIAYDLPYNDYTSSLKGESVVALFTLLPIMDKLARRCPEADLDGYQVNFYGMLIWIQRQGSELVNPMLWERVKTICAYFDPDIDLEDLPLEEVLKERAKGTLFDFSCVQKSTFIKCLSLYTKDSVFTPDEKFPEVKYLWKRLNDLQVQKLLKDQFPAIGEKNPIGQLAFLFANSKVMASKDHFLSRPYLLLRAQTTMLNETLAGEVYRNDHCWNNNNRRDYTSGWWFTDLVYVPIEKLCWSTKEIVFELSGKRLLDLEDYYWNRKAFTDPYRIGRNPRQITWKPPRSQSDIIGSPEKSPYYRNQVSGQLWDMIQSERSDQILRVFGWLKENKNTFDLADLQYLESEVFWAGDLKKQLQTSPQVASAIGNCFTEVMDYLKEINAESRYFAIVYFCLKVKRYCQHYAPDHVKQFPSIQQHINKFFNNQPYYYWWDLLALSAVSVDHPPNGKDSYDLYIPFYRAFYYQHPKIKDNHSKCYISDLIAELQMRYWEWKPHLDKFIQDDQQFRDKVLNQLLKDKGILSSEMTESWKKEEGPGCLYRQGNLIFDFTKGEWKGTYIQADTVLNQLKRRLSVIDSDAIHLKEIDGDNFATPERTLVVKRAADKWLVYKNTEKGRTYQYLKIDHQDSPPAWLQKLSDRGYPPSSEDRFWIESTDIKTKELLIYHKGELKYSFAVEQKGDHPTDYLIKSVLIGSEALRKVDSNLMSLQLFPLKAFCSLDKIQCFAKEGEDHLARLTIPTYSLSFDVEEVNGEWHAVDKTHFSRYAIAPQQHHPSLKGFASSLLLENDLKQYKVLIPANQYISSLFIPLLPNFIKMFFGDKAPRDESKYYVYEIDSAGNLTSEDPESLAYLMIIYMFQGQHDKVAKCSSELESLGRQHELPETLDKTLLLLAIVPPGLVPNIRQIRLGLLASIEENRQLHEMPSQKPPVNPSKTDNSSDDTSLLMNLVWSGVILTDLLALQKEKNPRLRLREDQEWFLFQAFARYTERLVTSSSFMNPTLKSYINKFGFRDALEFVGGNTELGIRYNELKQKLGFKDHAWQRVWKSAWEFFNTPSEMQSGIQTLATPLQTILQSWIGTLINHPITMEDVKEFLPQLQACFMDAHTHLDVPKLIKKIKRNDELEQHFERDLDLTSDIPSEMFNLPQISAKHMKAMLPLDLKMKPLTSESIVEDIILFYAIAKEGNDQETGELQAALLLNKGGWNKQTSIFIDLLENVITYPCLFKSTVDVVKLFQEGKETAIQAFFDESNKTLTTCLIFRLLVKFLAIPMLKVKSAEYVFDYFSNRLGFSINGFSHKQPTSLSKSIMTTIASSIGLKLGYKTWNYIKKQAFNTIPIDKYLPTFQIPDSWMTSRIGQKLSLVWNGSSQPIRKDPPKKEIKTPTSNMASIRKPKTVFEAIGLAIQIYDSLYVSTRDPYKDLAAVDNQFDQMFKSLFDTAFELVKTPEEYLSIEKNVEQLDDSKESRIEKEGIRRFNASLEKAYDRPSNRTPNLRFKDSEALWSLYLSLSTACKIWQQQLDKERKQLLEAVGPHVTFEELCRFFLKGTLGTSGLSVKNVSQLDKAIARHLVKYTRFQQMQRVLRLVEEISQTNPHSQGYDGKLELLATAFSGRAYRLKSPPEGSEKYARMVRHFLVCECLSPPYGVMLWPGQVDAMQNLYLKGYGTAMIELMMGLGKTDKIEILLNALYADQNTIVSDLWTPQLAKTNIRLMAQHGKMFGQPVNRLKFNRQMPLDKKHLDTRTVIFHRVMNNGETIQQEREDAQSFELRFIESLFKKWHNHKHGDDTAIIQHAQLLWKQRKNGLFIGDEPQELCKVGRKQNYPIGEPQTAELSTYRIIEECFRILIKNLEILEKIRGDNRLKEISSEDYEKISQDIVIQMSQYGRLKIHDKNKQQEFVDFVLRKTKSVPDWILNSPYYTEISMVRGMIKPLLPLLFSRVIDVDYSFSRLPNNGEQARPCDRNKNTLEKATIQNPWEAIVKTLMLFLHHGLNHHQVLTLVSHLRNKAKKESIIRNVPESEATAWKIFHEWIPHADLMHLTLHGSEWDQISQTLSTNTQAIFLYVRHYVREQILFWTRNIQSNHNNFSSGYHRKVFMTGTTYSSESTSPIGCQMLLNPETTGEAIHIISQKCPKDGIHVLKNEEPRAILQEVLERFFTPGSNYSAIIAGGKGDVVAGLDDEDAVQIIMDYVKKYRPDIKAINGFKKDSDDKDVLMAWVVGDKKPILYDLCKVPPEQQLSYYGAHGFGTNIVLPPNSKILDLVSETMELHDLLQESFRARLLKVFKKLLSKGKKRLLHPKRSRKCNMDQTQSIHFAMTKRTHEKICGDKTITLPDLIAFSQKNEIANLAVKNYEDYCDKIHDIVRSEVLDKLESADDIETMLAIFDEFNKVFCPRTKLRPQSALWTNRRDDRDSKSSASQKSKRSN